METYSVAELDLYTSSNLLLLPTRLCPDEAHVAFYYDYGAVFHLCEIVCVLVFVCFFFLFTLFDLYNALLG